MNFLSQIIIYIFNCPRKIEWNVQSYSKILITFSWHQWLINRHSYSISFYPLRFLLCVSLVFDYLVCFSCVFRSFFIFLSVHLVFFFPRVFPLCAALVFSRVFLVCWLKYTAAGHVCRQEAKLISGMGNAWALLHAGHGATPAIRLSVWRAPLPSITAQFRHGKCHKTAIRCTKPSLLAVRGTKRSFLEN